MKTLIAGLGDRLMGDDGFGSFLVEELTKKELSPEVEVIDYGTSVTKLLVDLENYDLVVLLDAISKGGRPGTVYKERIRPEDIRDLSPEEFNMMAGISYHGINLVSLLEVAKALGVLKGKVIIFGAEPDKIALRIGLSQTMGKALQRVVEEVLRTLEDEWQP
ncbi:MAG: hydrogenase maturation protease [Nitrososphaeria archaeon]